MKLRMGGRGGSQPRKAYLVRLAYISAGRREKIVCEKRKDYFSLNIMAFLL
jgi:hypothetical protein